MDEMKSITLDDVSAAQKHFAADRANLVVKTPPPPPVYAKAARVPEGVAENPLSFDGG